ncbi:MAG: type II secretion system protein GspN [Nitrospirae bacterium]|nr:type II secretion system protein GspN [Nitrospirota bacterium]
MTKTRFFILLMAGILAFIVLVWLIVIPEDVIKTAIEDSISNNGQMDLKSSVNGLRKGLLFSVYADNIELNISNTPALIITDISCRINPLYAFKKNLNFSIRGKIGTGDVQGLFDLPSGGILKLEKADLSAIPYLSSIGFQSSGLISASLFFKKGSLDITFEVPAAEIQGSMANLLPVNSFKNIQGTLMIQGNSIKITSITMDTDKGRARFKGDMINGLMNLTLELMPAADKLNSLESTLISKYLKSPGYYVIPIKRHMP